MNKGDSASSRRRPSVIAATLAVVLAVLVYLAYRTENPGRGYTALGLIFGIFATILFLAALLYAWRKRGGQERLPWRLEAWLWAHWILSAVAVAVTLLHAGFNVNGRGGTWTLLAALAVIASGTFGWLRYRKIPLDVSETTGNLAVKATQQKLKQVRQRISDSEAGRSKEFRECARRIRSGVGPAVPASVGQAEKDALQLLSSLLISERELLMREAQQRVLHKRMRSWLWVHVPASLALVLLLPYHIYNALDIHYSLFTPSPTDFQSPEACAACHPRQYTEWIGSMHAIAQSSPVTDLQTRLVSPVLGDFCEKCHAPTGTIASPTEFRLPLIEVTARAPASAFGVSCVSCHQVTENPGVLIGEDADKFPFRNNEKMRWQSGRTYVGPFGSGKDGDPKSVGNSFHRGAWGSHFNSSSFCASCHTVWVAENAAHKSFALQNTWNEWREGGKDVTDGLNWGDTQTERPSVQCLGCHNTDLSSVVTKIDEMQQQRVPLAQRRKDIRPIIESHQAALVPSTAAVDTGHFDASLPLRGGYSHTFTGVDYHLEQDLPYPSGHPSQAANESIQQDTACRVQQLLRLSAAVRIERWPTSQNLEVGVVNLATGHHFPAGFAFARESWFEISVSPSRSGEDWVVVEGGANGKSLPANLRLNKKDPGTRNFQAVLFNEQASDITKTETVVQHEATKVLKFAKDFIDPELVKAGLYQDREQFLEPGEIRRISIPLSLRSDDLGRMQRVRVRMLFRNLPPEFLQGLADRLRIQSDERNAQRAEALIDNLRIFAISEDIESRDGRAKPDVQPSCN